MIQTFTGVAYLAAMHRKFPLRALKVFKGIKRPAMAVLPFFFGKSTKAIAEYCRMCADRPHMLEIYLLHRWGSGLDSPNRSHVSKLIENGNKRTIRKIRKRIARIQRMIEPLTNDNTLLVMGLDLESRMSEKAVQIVQNLVDEVWPHETCSISHRDIRGADYVEIHHDANLGAGQIGTLDGQEIRFKHRDGNYGDDSISEEQAHDYMRRNYGRCEAIMYWSKLHQGLTGNTASSKPPKRRHIDVPGGDIKWMRKSMKRIQK